MTDAERISRLRRWWNSARSTVIETTWEARFWACLGIAGILHSGLANSIAVVFFMSAWANYRAAALTKKEAQREMLEEEAEEA